MCRPPDSFLLLLPASNLARSQGAAFERPHCVTNERVGCNVSMRQVRELVDKSGHQLSAASLQDCCLFFMLASLRFFVAPGVSFHQFCFTVMRHFVLHRSVNGAWRDSGLRFSLLRHLRRDFESPVSVGIFGDCWIILTELLQEPLAGALCFSHQLCSRTTVM